MTISDIFIYAPFGVFVLTFALFVLRLRVGVRAQAIWAMVLLLGFSKFFCFKQLTGSAFTPELPELVIWVWDWLYSGCMILFALSILFFFRFPFKAYLLPIAAWGLSAWGLWNGISVPGVHEETLYFENLPDSLNGYRIVQLADIHCSSAARRWRTAAIVDIANAQNADLICLTGDNSDGEVAWASRFLQPIRDLRARDGVFAVTGNHEYYATYSDWMDRFYSKTKIRFLENECVFPHAGLALGGVPDAAAPRYGQIGPDTAKAFAAATNGEFRVLLQHQPKWAESNARSCGVSLQLSGHTHGGIAPVIRELVASHNAGYSRGIYRFGPSVVYVSPGCGQWPGFPMRFFNPSEVTVITLQRKPKENKQ